MSIIELSAEKWNLFSHFFHKQTFGRPQKWSDKKILKAVLYVLQTGCQWRKLPKEFPPYQTVYGRFRQWQRSGILCAIRDTLLQILKDKGLKLEATYVDATFVRAMCGGEEVGLTKVGKGSKIMAIVDANSRPLAAIAASANPHELTLLDQVLEDIPEEIKLKRLIGDRAYDSDHHDEYLQQKGIELIAAHKKNRQRPKTQDGRKLRRLKKRWVVERLFAWMKPARRLLNRFEKKISVFQTFLDLFCILVLIKDL